MRNRRLLWLPCLAVLLAGNLGRASAQSFLDDDGLEEKRSRSHLIDANKFGLPAANAEALFLQRLKTIHSKEIGEGLGKKLQREQLDQLLQNRELVEKYLKEFTISKLPAELQKKFAGREAEIEKFVQSMSAQEFLKYAQEAHGLQPSPPASGDLPGTNPAPVSPPSPPQPPPASDSAPQSEAKPQAETASEASAGDQPTNSVLRRWLMQAANRFKDLDPSLRNSEALHKVVRELSYKIEGADERWKELDKAANAAAEKWSRLGQALPLDRLWPEGGFSWPRGLTGESWSKWRLPETGSRFGRSAANSAPWTGTPGWTEGNGWRALGVLGILVLLGVVFWKTLRRTSATGLSGTAAWRLGPWPVQPSAVQTREELIRAFEYLSILLLGPAARHWHHWAIASNLGESASPSGARFKRTATSRLSDGSAERRRAAEQLASLYERARYAPPSEPLPEAALATARRDLCLLAGVSLS